MSRQSEIEKLKAYSQGRLSDYKSGKYTPSVNISSTTSKKKTGSGTSVSNTEIKQVDTSDSRDENGKLKYLNPETKAEVERLKKYSQGKSSRPQESFVNKGYLDNFKKNVDKYFSMNTDDIKNRSVTKDNVADKKSAAEQMRTSLAKQSKLIRKYYETNKDGMTEEEYKNTMWYLDSVDMKMSDVSDFYNDTSKYDAYIQAKDSIENLDANAKEEARLRRLSYDELVKEYNDKQTKVTTDAKTVEDILNKIKNDYLNSEDYTFYNKRDPEMEKDIEYIDTILGRPDENGRYQSPDKDSEEYKEAYNYLSTKYAKELGEAKLYGDPNKALTTNDGKILTYKNLIYNAENKEQFEKLRGNEQALSTYEELDAIDNDIATISSIIAVKKANGHYTLTERDYEKMNYIAEKYNVNLDDSNAVEIGNGLINKLKNDKAVKVDFLKSKEGGDFDYERMREYANRQVEAQDQAYLNSKYSDFARQFPFLATLGNLSLAPLQGMEGLEGVVDGLAEDEYDPKNYTPIDYNSMGITSMNQHLSSAVSQAIAEGTYLKDGTALMKGMSDILVDEYGLTKEEADIQVMSALYNEGFYKFLSSTYGGVTSAIQSRGIALATSALGTAIGTAYTGNPVAGASIGNIIGEALTLTIMSSQAMASSLYDGIERGLDNESAVYTALASGINEVVFEKLSFENFMKLKTSINPQSLGKSIANSVKDVFVASAIEGSEEVFTDIANRIADGIINADMSEYHETVDRYLLEGYSQKEAEKKANEDFLVQLFESFYGGAIGGGLGGMGKIALNTATAGANAVANKVATNRAEYEAGTNVIANENIPNLIEEANASGNDKLMKLAETVSESKNEKKSDVRKVGKLAMEVTKASADTYSNATESVQSKYIESELKNNGVEATKENVAIVNKIIGTKNFQPGEYEIAQKIKANEVAEKVLEKAEVIENEANDIRKKAISTVQNISFMRRKADAKTSETGKAYNTKTNEEVKIDSIASVNYNKKTGAYEMKLKLDNGEVIDAKDIKYKNASDSALYTAIETSGLDAESANIVLNMYDPHGRLTAYKYYLGMTEGIEYGRLGLDANKITSNNSWFGDLTPIQKETAIKLGKIATESKYKNAQERINEIRKKSEGKTTRNGKVTYLTDIMSADPDTLTDKENASVIRAKSDLEMLQALSDNNIIANDIVVFSTEEVDGKRVFAQDVGEYKKGDVCPFNGFYNKKTGEIYVDVFSGSNGEGLVLNVVAHELTHFVKQWSPSDYKILADFVVEEYQNNGYDIDREIAIKRDRMQESRKSQVTNEEALEELVADSMQKMFVDGDLANKLAVLKFRSESLVGKLSDYLNKLSDKINKLARKEDSINKRLDIDKLAKNFSDLADVFAEAVNNATNTFEVARAVLEDNGYQYDDETGTILPSSRFSTGTTNEANINREKDLIQAIMISGNISRADAKAFVSAEENLSKMVKGTILDYEGNDLETAIKSNADYPQGTIDLTNICTKRATITALTNNLQEALPTDLFTADDYADIRLIMMNDGRTVACGLCYVEDRRQHLGEIAKDFIGEWNKAAKNGTNLKRYNSEGEIKDVSIGKELAKRYGVKTGKVMPTAVKINQASLISSNAWHHIQKSNPLLAASFEAFNNARGQSAGRLLLDRAEYKREILKWTDPKVKEVNDAGGLRIFSFSDFEVIHLVDLMQIIEDCAAKGVKIQGYTKQADFARLIRNTGIKVNRSLIPFGATGLKTVNGKKVLAIDSIEGIDIEGENFMDETDNPNVGNNITGINDEQIKVAMLDNFIHYIIPFHTNKSGKVNAKLGVAEWYNYKPYQEDRVMPSAEGLRDLGKTMNEYKSKGLSETEALKEATKVLAKRGQEIKSLPKGGGINIYTDVLSDPSIKNERQFTEKYLEVCRERNIVPRFAQFLNVNEDGDFVYTPGYSKMLVDFKTFDYATGKYLPQQTVSLQFKDEADRKSFDGYVRELVEKELKKTKEEINGEDYPKDLYNNILNYIRAKHGYKDADMKSYEKFKGIVDAQAKDTNSDEGKGKRVESPSSVFSDRDSDGNKLSEGQQEYFKDSKVRDEEGHLIPVYHGTEANFTVFDSNKARTNMDIQGSFFSPWKIDASGYGSNVKMYYLNITNPASEADGYKALKKFQGQNNAGMKARNYLIEKGYDGVNNGNEEYIAFYPEQIKLVDNLNPTTDKDIRFSDRDTKTISINETEGSAETGEAISYSVREEAPPKKTIKAYKLMRLVNGKLYPLFIGNNEEVKVGTWYNADSPNLSQLKSLPTGTHLIDMNTGDAISWEEYADQNVPKNKKGMPSRGKPNADDIRWANNNGYRFMLIEDKSDSSSAKRMMKQYGDARAYYNWGINGDAKSKTGEGSASLYALRPGWHFGEVPSMHQIGYGENKDIRLDNQVWVEVEMSADVDYNEEARSNYSGDIPTHIPTDGYYTFATNPTQKKTANDITKANWYVAGAFKPVRIISDYEADNIVNRYNKENGTSVPLDHKRANGRRFDAESMKLTEGYALFSDREENFATDRKELAKKYNYSIPFNTEMEFFKQYQEGKANPENFFKNTMAVFNPIARRPKGNPDYVSLTRDGEVSSEYWYTPEGVIRGSKHWGSGIKTVDWQLGDNRYGRVVNGNKEYGFCAWDDFVYKTYVADAKRDSSTGLLTDFSNARLTSFENPGVQFSDRDTPTDNRTLLANALATTTQNEIEANKIAEYQSKIQEMNAVQDELNKVRAELREQMFKKGGRKENFNDLKAKAQTLANKINTYDKQLLRLESTQALKNVLEREKANAVKKAKAEYREMIANRKEKANNTEVRHKIKWLVDEFNRMQNHPTEKKYIPQSLIVPVNDLLMAVNLDSGRSEKLSEKLNSLYTQYSQLRNDPKNLMAYDETVADIIGKLATTIGNKSVYKMNSQELDLVYKALAGLMHVVKTSVKVRGIESNKNAYEISMKMKDETMSVDKTTNKFLKALKSPLKLINRSLRPETAFNRFGNYTKNSMWSKMYNVLNDGQTKQLRIQLEANSIFEDTFKKTKYLRSLTDTKNLVDVGLKDANGNTVKITKGMALAIYKAMQNEDNMRHILRGGFTVPDLNAYYKGKGDAYGEGHINVRLVDSARLTELREELADINKQLEKNPNDLELLAQQDVIEYEIDKEIGNGDQLGLEMFHKIQDMLTPDDEQFLDEVRYLFDEYLRGELNKTTMELYGFEKAHIDNYLPIHTDPNFRTAQFESIAKDMSLENSGFMKDRVNASNPIMLEDLSTMVSSQIDKVARYSGLSVPIKDFQKVFGKSEINYNSSLQDALSSKFGNDAKKYIENLMADLVGGRMRETNIFDKLRGHMAGATLSVNPRVAFAQAASYPTAASEIGYKPLLKAMKMGLKSADRELIAKYSPLLWYRNENGRDVEMGDVAKMSRASDKLMKKTQWLMGWINAMDTATVGRLWYASQYYVDDNFNLEKGTDEYYMKVAEVFNRVVEKTQPNYTTLQRPDILRSTNAITKQLTMFMTQRLQNFNIVYDATAQYMKYRHDASHGLNGVTKADVKEARVGLARAVSSQVLAGLMITGIKFGVDFLLHSMNGYKDDDEQLTWDSIINQLIKNFGETMVSNIIGGSEINELANSLISGDTYYGVSVTAVETFTDLVKGFINEATSIKTSIDINGIRDDLRAEVVATLGEEALSDAEADTIQNEIGNLAKMLGYTKTELNDRYGVNVNSDPKVVEKTRKLAESLAQLFGLPLRNIDKIAEGLMAHIDDAANGMLFNYIGTSVEDEEPSAVFGDAMVKFNQGDMDGAVEIIKGIYQEKVDSGTEPSKAQSSVKSTMTNRLKPIYIKADASKRNEIRKLMYATGMYKSLDALDKVIAKWK